MTRILIADDISENLYLLTSLLEGHGYEVVAAANGAEALALAQSAPPELIVTDILMPVMDGFELCRRWKQDERLKRVPFVFYTASYTDQKDERLAISLGADRFVVKPQQPEVLLQLVSEVLAEAGGKRPAVPSKPLGEEMEVLRQHNEALFRKLERKMLQLQGDIAERKNTEMALQESERKYRELVEHANSIILRWTSDGRIIFLNEFGQRAFGYTQAEIVGRHVVGTIVPETEATGRDLRPLIEEICADPQKFERSVNENVRRSGERFWVDWTNKVVFDEQGRIREILSIGSDITERRRILEALRERESQLALILNNVSDVIFAIAVEPDDGFRFTSVNHRFLETTGLREGQVVGALVRDVIPEPGRTIALGKYHGAIINRGPTRWEEVSEYPAGTKIGQVTVVPVFDDRGACTQLVGMVHDITDRKQAEEQVRALNEELRRHAEDLEERIRARTAQLAARNQELKDFAYTVSHDLKAPLRGIAGYASELDRRHRAGLSERALFCLAQILTAVGNLDRLIEDLLHYSRLDAETPSLTDVDLRDMVDSILSDRELAITEQHVEVTLDVPSITLRTWERGLGQVLANLIDNAIKYSRKSDPPRLRIAAAALDDAWRLTVSDNGIGFDMKYHDRIFGLFNRLVRMEEYEGTGAGLAIVRKVLDKQGGRIWAESEPGQGATFFVEIPRPRDAE